MINLLPGVDERDWILAKFYNHPDWTHRCIHFPTFISEVNCFYSRHFALLSPGESFPQISLDLLWLALFFQILSNGIEAGLVKSCVWRGSPNFHAKRFKRRPSDGLLLVSAVWCLESNWNSHEYELSKPFFSFAGICKLPAYPLIRQPLLYPSWELPSVFLSC
ncbi:hypothetical protein BT69DRAFT_1061607 [Atractiella rhizophila]|nr:hypothetical protein BT69DRAFT_1061607 [Atractiella rhizophila]